MCVLQEQHEASRLRCTLSTPRGEHLPPGLYNLMPAGSNSETPSQDRRCWMHDILPYIDQEPLFSAFDGYMAGGGSALGFPQLTPSYPH